MFTDKNQTKYPTLFNIKKQRKNEKNLNSIKLANNEECTLDRLSQVRVLSGNACQPSFWN